MYIFLYNYSSLNILYFLHLCIHTFSQLWNILNNGLYNISLCPFCLLSSPEDPIRSILSLFIPSSISCNFPPYFYIFILLISFWAQLFLLLLTHMLLLLYSCWSFIVDWLDDSKPWNLWMHTLGMLSSGLNLHTILLGTREC